MTTLSIRDVVFTDQPALSRARSPLSRSTIVLAVGAVAGTVLANSWWFASTAAYANSNLGGRMPLVGVLAGIVAIEIGHVALWLIVTVALALSFKVFEDADRVPRFAVILLLTGAAHVPVFVASGIASALWHATQAQVAAADLTGRDYLLHPALWRMIAVSGWIRTAGYCAAAVWLGVHIAHSWSYPIRHGLKIALTPVAVVAILLGLASRLLIALSPAHP